MKYQLENSNMKKEKNKLANYARGQTRQNFVIGKSWEMRNDMVKRKCRIGD